jgi:hypothetical protein
MLEKINTENILNILDDVYNLVFIVLTNKKIYI